MSDHKELRDLVRCGIHPKVVTVQILLNDYDRLRQQCDELTVALENIAQGSPDVKPEYYSGDNHGDSWDNGYEICHFELGRSARTAIAKYRETT